MIVFSEIIFDLACGKLKAFKKWKPTAVMTCSHKQLFQAISPLTPPD